jgi:hypothetical protein
MTVSGGSSTFSSLNNIGGICRQVFISAQTNTTIFKMSIVNDDDLTVRQYALHTGEINDLEEFPIYGVNNINITNVSNTDTFDVLLLIQE